MATDKRGSTVYSFIHYSINFYYVYYSQPSSVKILVPGSGLGRLAFDIAHLGYYCQGNEFSMYMLIASNFMLNR